MSRLCLRPSLLLQKVSLLMVMVNANVAQVVAADKPALTNITIERLFSGKEFALQDPEKVVWCPRNTKSYLTLRVAPQPDKNAAGSTMHEIARVDLASGDRATLVTVAELTPAGTTAPLTIDAIHISDDESKLLLYTNSQRVWRRKTRGDYWLFDLQNRILTRLGGVAKPATMQFAKFSPDASHVAYVCENNIYVQSLADLQIRQVTTDGSPTCINGTADWVNEEELSIRDGFRWSPDGNSIAFWQFDTSGVSKFHLIDNNAGLYPKVISFAYPKVGQLNSATRVGVVPASGGDVRWMAVAGDPREHYIASMQWTPTGDRLLIQQLNRLQNRNVVLLADPQTGATTAVFTEQDAAWVDSHGPVIWLDNGQSFLWLSERDGWRHAYQVSRNGSTTLLTPGAYDVINIDAVDTQRKIMYFTASPDNATQRHLFRVSLNGGAAERHSPPTDGGWSTYDISPDAQWAVHTYSTFATPPVVTLVNLSTHAPIRVLADNAALRTTLAGLRAPTTGFMKVPLGDGTLLDGWYIYPPELDRSKSYPLFFHVYGEPYGQTVRDTWSGTRALWHWMLAQAGYVVVSVDCRGTKVPRGRAWRKSVYEKIGILPPAEHATAIRFLLQQWSFTDPKRVGVWGWSGGGSNTLHLIFRYPELFHTAIAVAPNPDQLLYDTIYQERYMGLPDTNAEAFREGSPITHAAGLKGNLLLIHGTGDDNGHFQGTEKLMNELIRLNKDFTVMPYPSRSHAINEGENTVPHFFGLMTKYLMTHLPVN
jgi:dipeptidyl-peptidase 4